MLLLTLWWTPVLVSALTFATTHMDNPKARWPERSSLAAIHVINEEMIADARSLAKTAAIRLSRSDCEVSDAYIAISECVQTATLLRASPSIFDQLLRRIPDEIDQHDLVGVGSTTNTGQRWHFGSSLSYQSS